MFGPVRALYSIGRHASPAVMLSMIATTLMFTATPFLIGPLSEEFGIGRGYAGAISIAQVGVFAIANLAIPRLTTPSQGLYRSALVGMVVAGALSAIPTSFPLLLVVRGVAGAGAGVLTWVAWAEAMRYERSMAAVSSIGPLTALVGAPVFALASEFGVGAVYWVLAASALPGLAFTLNLAPGAQRTRQRSRSRSNRILLVALALMTFSGASLFVYESIAASQLFNLSPTATSLAFSLNAAAGLLGAQFSGRHVVPGRWMVSVAPAALLTIWGGSPALFYLGMAWWGFAFWMSVPGVMQMLAQRSLARDERAGDAQALMAFGRAGGPAMGGLFVDAGSFGGLALMASAGLALSGAMVMGVQEGRERLPVTDARVA